MCSPRKVHPSRTFHQVGHNGKGNYAERSGAAVFKTPFILQIAVRGDDKRVIWFFLAGFIGGVVGTVLFAGWWVRSHAKRVTMEEFMQEVEDSKQEEKP